MRRHRALSIAAAVVGALGALGCDEERAWECTVPDGEDAGWMRRVGCEADYARLADERDDAVFARTSTVNWLIDREDGGRLYFIDTVRWDLHYTFAAVYLDGGGLTPVGSHDEFNLLNYRRANRRFLLGKLVHYRDQGLVTLELSAGDSADADMIVEGYERVAAAIFDGRELRYRPVSARQEELLPRLERRIPVVRTEEVFRDQRYQPLNQRTGYGTLRFARVSELADRPVLPTEIVVVDRVPLGIAMVSGLITAELQTPLAHVNILSKNRGTPNMALRGAFDDPELRAHEGALVRLTVSPQEFAIERAEPSAARAYWERLRPAEPLVPAYDLSLEGLRPLSAHGWQDAPRIGSKAANLAELMTLPGVPVPDQPLAVPFAHYRRHLEQSGVDSAIERVLADAQGLAPAELQRRLFAIRWAIFEAPLDPALLAELVAAVQERWGADRAIRFRSSTNAEDRSEFSGAGLYTSASGTLARGEQHLADALKVVWASAWSYRAFVERDFYRVDHRAVQMGVLVHPAFVGEAANGVALTINEFSSRRPAYYVNAQVGEVSVTNPTGLATPEQLLYYTWYEEPEYEVITRSSLSAGPVLSAGELGELAGYLEAIHGHFRGLAGSASELAMDVELVLDSGRSLVIKQARPLQRR